MQKAEIDGRDKVYAAAQCVCVWLCNKEREWGSERFMDCINVCMQVFDQVANQGF